jgi:hypothetical protein
MTAPFPRGLTIGFLLLFPIPTLAAEVAIGARGATITVRVWDRDQPDAGILDRARQVTENIFRPVQLEIRWVDCLADPVPQRCISPVGPNDISVRIYRRPAEARRHFRQKIAGVSSPSPANGGSGFIQVFFDRLEEISQNSDGEALLELLLGITIAHEIGHLLLPGYQHSRSGIMVGCWGLRNLQLAAKGWVCFTAEQRLAIAENVRKWSNLPDGEQLAVLQR